MTRIVDIYLYEERHGELYAIASPTDIKFQIVEDKDRHKSELQKPTFSLDRSIADDFLNAMAIALAKIDIKPEKDSVLQGKFEATKYHLEDMRKLLKL